MDSTEDVAQSEDTVTKPHDWDKAVAAAYLRLIGQSQQASADGAGIGRRTLVRYEKADWWPDACEEAADRWLSHLVEESRRTLLRGVKDGNANLALSILERVDRRLTPAAQRHELTGKDGGPVQHADVSDEELKKRAIQLKNRLVALEAQPSTNGKH